MISPRIARVLRAAGYDVVAVKERPDLIGPSDGELAAAMVGEMRAIVTNDADDFRALAERLASARNDHAGVVLTFDRTLPRTATATDDWVRELGALLDAHPGDDALRNRVILVRADEGAGAG